MFNVATDLEIMRLHVAALYLHDKRGRLVIGNEPTGSAPPRFFLGRTIDGSIARFRDDLPDALADELQSLANQEPASIDAAPAHESDYLTRLAVHSPIQDISSGPAYIFDDIPNREDHETVVVTHANIEVLRGELEPWCDDVRLGVPMTAVLDNGHAVAVCGSVRITPEAHEAGVETIVSHRGRGCAPAACREWAKMMSAAGRLALYSTSCDNRSSQRVAEKLGLRQYGVTFSVA